MNGRPETLPVLTLRRPWGFAVAYAGKDVENRTQRTHYRGPLAIHSGLRMDDVSEEKLDWIAAQAGLSRAEMADLDVPGAVVAVVDVVDCHKSIGAASGCRETGLCSPWAVWRQWHWRLGAIRRLDEPVPHSGSQGLRRLQPDADRAVRRQLRALESRR